MDRELISVIIPIYKVEDLLERCVNSVINQTYDNLQIILVDDGSPDNCPKLCDDFAKKDSRIFVIHKENGGLSDARNYGIEKAKGKYITFIDSDDYIDDRMIEILYSNLIEKNADISICKFEKVYNDSKIVKSKLNNVEVMTREETIYNLIIDKKFNNYAWNKLYKTEFFKNIKYPVGKKMEDIGTTYKILELVNSVVYTDYVGYYYYQRESSILGNLKEDLIYDYIDMMDEWTNHLYSNYNHLKFEIDKMYFSTIIHFHILCIKNNNKELYDNLKMKKQYLLLKKIVKENNILKLIKGLTVKRKIMVLFLLINRNLAFKIL